MFGPAIVAREIECSGKVILSRDPERGVAETLCDGLNPFRGGTHLRDVTTRVQVMAAHIGRHPSESSRVVKRLGQLFGFSEIPPDHREFVEREERLAKIKTKIDRTLDLLARFGQWAQRHQCLVEAGYRLTVSRSSEGLGAGLPEVRDRLLPHFAPKGMVSQALDLFCQPIRVEHLDGLHNPGMEFAAALLEQAPVSDLVGEGVLEGVLEIREEARFI
jgi:hypothetical protein